MPTSLTGRLVATLVTLVVLASVLLAVGTSLAMRGFLNGQLDDQVRQALGRSVGRYDSGFAQPPPGSDGDDGPGPRLGLGDAAGTLSAQFSPSGQGVVVTSSSTRRLLSSAALERLDDVPADGRIHDVDLPGVGPFRVEVRTAGPVRLIAGLSTHDVDSAIGQLVVSEVLLALVTVALALVTGRWLVRRQLRPLRDVAATAHEVADLPLSRGEIGTTVRVPEALTDERTEVGAVGAALNTLLVHVEQALDDRHRSELQVRQFVADASHELRTPLSTIHGYAELSRRTRPSDPVQLAHAMSKVEAEATRMSSLVEDLLLLARLDAGRPLARDEVDLTKLVLETVGDARVVGPDHRWNFDLADEPVLVLGDEQRLHQVVTNLLNNARRHTPPGTRVTAGVRQDGDQVALTVEDDGPGMSPELVSTAFERFSRGDSSRTRESGGAGLGLSLVEAITAAHGGTVSVESRPGRTCVEVRLPAIVGAAAPALHR
ncbi:MAG: HAMP domain-containing sensor histidine kinase [Nocardioidaceae bacterium]